MADFSALKAAIQAAIRQNGNNEITGNIMQGILLSIVNTLGDAAINQLVEIVDQLNSRIADGYMYGGIATPTDTPAASSGKVFYIATQAGTYTHYGSLVVTQGINILKTDNVNWTLEVVWSFDSVPTLGSDNPVKSDGVAQYYGDYEQNPEYIRAIVDSTRKFLEGIRTDGTKEIASDLVVGGDMTLNGNRNFMVENPEFVRVVTDKKGKILWAITIDGGIYYGAGCPSQVRDYIDEKLAGLSLDEYDDIVAFLSDYLGSDTTLKTIIDSINERIPEIAECPEFIEVETDSEGKVLSSRNNEGVKKEYVGFETPNVTIGGHTIENFEDPEGRTEILTDAEGKIISYRDSNGVKHEEVGIETDSLSINHLDLSDAGMTEFQQALKDSGFNLDGDWSDAKSIEIPIPRCAIANITNDSGDATWPTSKGVDLKYYLEFWDMQGNYFKKEIIFNAQGNSSMAFVKKNGSADFCNNNGWDDDDTFSIKFGDWVAQDSFHFKAYYTDYIKGSCVVAYQISEAVYKTRGVYADVPWKKALIDFSTIGITTPAGLSKDGIKDVSLQIDNGARCMPDGFPCIFYLNGEFYGIYSWQLKKQRDNYHFNKSNPGNIQLDGTLYTSYLWGGSIDWTQFEVRNPKDLVYASAHGGSYKYDADVAQDEIAGNSNGSPSYDSWEPGSYPVDKIVKHGNHYYINSIANNDAEPIYDAKNNGDDAPDFKNKTGCGWINCTNTIKVKNHIINLSHRVGEINALNETDSAAAKELFDTYFDADNIIDYQLINMAVNDPDGFGKNWQWITYDGIKWYVCQYDKDMSFGNHWTGMFTRDISAGWGSSSTELPTGLAIRYYLNEHVARWKELVELGIFTADFFEKKIDEWVARIGQNNFKNEWKKWQEASCNRDSLIDFANWRFTGGYSAGTPSGDIWNEGTQYNSGQYVWFRCGTSSEYLQFRAKSDNIGKPCLTGLYTTYPTAMGYRDSVWRYFKFIEAQLEAQNNFINNLNA